MMNCDTELLLEYALGTLEVHARRTVEEHLASCEDCTVALRETSDAFALLALELPPAAPPARGLEQVTAAIADSGRFGEFAPEVAKIFGVPLERARELVRYLDESSRWMPGPTPGIKMMPVQAGPEYVGHTSTFVHIQPGETFPWHEHLGDEEFVVLQGACVEPDGQVFHRTEFHCHPAGTAHAFTVPEGGPPFVAAVRVAVGMRFVPPPSG